MRALNTFFVKKPPLNFLFGMPTLRKIQFRKMPFYARHRKQSFMSRSLTTLLDKSEGVKAPVTNASFVHLIGIFQFHTKISMPHVLDCVFFMKK